MQAAVQARVQALTQAPVPPPTCSATTASSRMASHLPVWESIHSRPLTRVLDHLRARVGVGRTGFALLALLYCFK